MARKPPAPDSAPQRSWITEYTAKCVQEDRALKEMVGIIESGGYHTTMVRDGGLWNVSLVDDVGVTGTGSRRNLTDAMCAAEVMVRRERREWDRLRALEATA